MRVAETATFVESDCLLAFPRAYKQRVTHIGIVPAKVFHYLPSVSLPLAGWCNGQVLQLIYTISFVCHNGYSNGFSFLRAVHDEQLSPSQITVNHRLLLVGQEKEGEEAFLVGGDKLDVHTESICSYLFQLLFHDIVCQFQAVGLCALLLLHDISPSLKEGACRDAYFRSDVADAVFHGVCFNPLQQSGGNAFSLMVLVDEHGVQVAVVADGGEAHDASFGIAGGDEV